MGLNTAAFLLAAGAVSWLVVGAIQAWWRVVWRRAWQQQLDRMTPEQRHEWRAWYVRDRKAAEEWMVDKALGGIQW